MKQFYKKRHFYLMIIPALAFYLSFMILPFVFDIFYSFTDYKALGTPNFVGLKNYARLFRDSFLGISIKNTLISTVVSTVLSLVISFFIAYTLDRKTKRNEISKIIVFAPYVIPTVLSALVWVFILSPTTGLLNNVLIGLGLESWTQVWINGPTLSPYSFAIVSTWASMGFYMLIWQEGIRSIDNDVIEASIIDGCTRSQRLRFVVLPLLRGTLTSNLIFSIVGGLKIYEIVYMMTGGGPFHKSESIVSYMYQIIFSGQEYGYGMSIAVIEGLLAIVLVFFFMKNSRKNADLT